MADETVENKAADGGYGAQLSVKFGNGGMVNIRAKNVQELITEVNTLADAGAFLVASTEEFQALAVIQQAFPETRPVADSGGGTQAAPAYGGNPICAHQVEMGYREGIGKTGKPYKMHYCKVENDPRLPKCQARFLN